MWSEVERRCWFGEVDTHRVYHLDKCTSSLCGMVGLVVPGM